MSGAPTDSYAHGLFRTASEGNISRRYKALRRKAAGTLSRPPSATRKPPASPKRDRVAEPLSRGMDFETIAECMSITPKAVSKHFEAIRKQLGPQAI